MNLKSTVTADTYPSRSVYMAYKIATDTAKEGQMPQKSDADMVTKMQMRPRYFIHATVPAMYFEIPENSSLPLEFDALGEYIDKNLRTFLEQGHVSKARLLLSSIPFGMSAKIDNLRKILAIPKATPEKIATGVDISGNFAWLQNNSGNFKGKWVALNRGMLIDSHESRIELHNKLRNSGKLKGAVFFKIDKE